jgi:glyoxylase-like metal-dependent hydrolase (beta-lactamase superfamily II)
MIRKISDNTFQLCFKKFGSCVYLLKLDKVVLIDTSTEKNREELISDLEKLRIKPEDIDFILVTHRHYDHIGNLSLFPNARILRSKDKEKIENLGIRVIKTPGHSSDIIFFLYRDILFSGDTLFHDGIGRVDLPDSEPKKMQKSLEKLKKLKYKKLCPGHL